MNKAKIGVAITHERAVQQARSLVTSDPKLRGLVENMISPSQAFCIPRIIPTRPAPKNYKATVKMPVEKIMIDENTSRFALAMTLKPNPDDFLSFGSQQPGRTWFFTESAGPSNTHYVWQSGVPFSLDTTLESVVDSAKKLRASTLANAPGLHYSSGNHNWLPGMKYYPTSALKVQANTKIVCNIKNFNPTESTNVTFHLWTISGGVLTSRASQTVLVNPGLNDVAVQINPVAADYPNIDGVALGFVLNTNTAATFSNVAAKWQIAADNTAAPIELGAGIVWESLTLWEILKSDCAEAQFRSSESYSVTGLAALIQNSSAKYYKNGKVYGAKLQGGTPIPGSFDQITKFISSIPKKYSNYDGLLEKGMHWFYTPDKLQDLEFASGIDKASNPPPYLLAALDGAWSSEGPPEFYLTFSINIECIGQDVGLTYLDSPMIVGLYQGLTSALAQVNPFCENPDHLTHIRNMVKKVLGNPAVLSAVGTAVQYGLKAAPYVASLL